MFFAKVAFQSLNDENLKKDLKQNNLISEEKKMLIIRSKIKSIMRLIQTLSGFSVSKKFKH